MEIREQRRIRPRGRQRVEIDIGRQQRFLEQWPARDHAAGRIDHRRCAGESLAALEADQIGERNEDTMLFGDAAHDALPAQHGRRQGLILAGIVCLSEPPGRRRARDDHELRAFERRDGGGQ